MSGNSGSESAGKREAQVYELPDKLRISLAEKAAEAKKGAYCPHSSFHVGCAILLSYPSPSNPSVPLPSTVLTGANVENASYPVGICAERCALAYAIANTPRPATHPPTDFSSLGAFQASTREQRIPRLPTLHAIAVSTDIWPPASPCGMCRQFIREFAPKSLPIYMYGSKGTETYEVRTLGELLPMSFGSDDLPPKGAPGTPSWGTPGIWGPRKEVE